MTLELIRVLARRLRETDEQIKRPLCSSASRAAPGACWRGWPRSRSPDRADRMATSPITHQQLADLVGTSRETITRVVKELKDAGWLEQEGKRYLVPSADAEG